MPEFLPRILVVLTGIVAFLVLFVGIRDCFGRTRSASPAVGASALTAANSNVVDAQSKRMQRRRAPESISETTASPSGLATTAAEGQLITEKLGAVETAYDQPKRERVQGARNQLDASRSVRTCAPLPNSTKAGDVDVLYYQNWANEYGCESQ